MDVMLVRYSKNEVENRQDEGDIEVDLESIGLHQKTNLTTKDFRSPFYTNCRENSEIAVETARMINDEITSQVTRKLNETKTEFKLSDT